MKRRKQLFTAALIFLGLLLFANQGFSQELKLRDSRTKHFTVHFAEALTTTELGALKKDLEDAYSDILRGLFEIVGGKDFNGRPIDIVIFGMTGDFTSLTGLPWWSASCVVGDSIYLQPMRTLKSRGILSEVIRHEVALVFIKRLSGGGEPPVWLAEGLSVHLSGEIERLRARTRGERPKVSGTGDIDSLLLDRVDIDKNRWGYILAYEAVKEMIDKGEGGEILRLLTGGR
ncbi:MAG: hypothetical protein JW984_11115 [Deltaproteobacteria bacterium]|uniref:Peptidase n=1 Tax=Candidatus Zymogenus saltonus TaxID=2844893 RepID=A0A9D8KGG6_9DELT|nr:hypothetical protein [Candidatus Zymogenus saltonus]